MIKRSRILAFFLLLIFIGSLMGTTTNSVLQDIKLGLDLQGGFEDLYDVESLNKGQEVNNDTLVHTVDALNRSINVLGVSEPNIQIEGKRIRVQLAGIEDQSEAREILGTQAELTFRDVNDNIMMDGTDLVEGSAKFTIDSRTNQPVSVVGKKDRKNWKTGTHTD